MEQFNATVKPQTEQEKSELFPGSKAPLLWTEDESKAETQSPKPPVLMSGSKSDLSDASAAKLYVAGSDINGDDDTLVTQPTTQPKPPTIMPGSKAAPIFR